MNAWNAATCRGCGLALSSERDQASAEGVSFHWTNEEESVASLSSGGDDSVEAPVEAPRGGSFMRRRWNIFWIMLGIGIHVVSIHFGVFAIIKYFIEPDPELKTRLEQAIESAGLTGGDPAEIDIAKGASDATVAKISTIRTLVITLLVVVPLVIGLVIGFFTGNILDGAASMGLSAVLIPLLNNAALAAVLWGPLNAGLGAAGAFLGFRLGIKAKYE